MNTILLGNLIKIRWIAIIGQLIAIFFVSFLTNINIPFYEALIIILFSIVINFYSYVEERKNKTISNNKAFLYLLFDTLQLGILLFLTGGRDSRTAFSLLLKNKIKFKSVTFLKNFYSMSISDIFIPFLLNFYMKRFNSH